ncbi:OPT superfamily oligopeptide transporter [Annulohypoxylon maeteangense]|uniref:OPT superfamily oligopeptide transporter n=1 Tax=Annulohypoxylon maeteangense TaxID=1927788 RepID=UPI002007DAA1|nr:OPT superfamily oligopeptide transporter [Annulohypoxylon maeteangense]KAI0885496.1 OPT superfamily oligopeptide transporter [Annulohypoxylon maeteangense]
MSSLDGSAAAESEAKFTSALATEEPPINRRPTSTQDDGGHHKDKLSIEEAIEVDVDLENENDPEISQIPPEVRRIVSLHDDPTLPTLTFRYFLLSVIFVIPGAFLSAMNSFRTTYAPYSVFFVQIAGNYVGLWLARVLPNRQIRIPFTKQSFNLNPGPWSVKEHVLITVTAASGATGNLAITPIALGDLYFNTRVHPAAAIFFMWSIDAIGYAFAAIARQVLLYEPAYPWFQALCQTALFETQHKQNKNPTPTARKQMRVFWWVLLGITLWQFLPEYVFPMTSSFAFLCWVAPHNPVANFIGSGLGGMGFLNLSFDWANISNYLAGVPLFLSPWWSQVVLFASFVMSCWVLLPAAKWGHLGGYSHCLMTNRACTANGSRYPVTGLLTPQNTFNQTAYEENGPIYLGVHYLWAIFFDYASYVSAYSWIAFFGASQIRDGYRKFRARQQNAGQGINHQYTDRLNVIMRQYKEVPVWWYIILFLCAFAAIMTMAGLDIIFIPWWTFLVALATGAAIVVPLGWLYAISNYQLPIGTFNELLYGTMVQNLKTNRNPLGASIYGSIAGDAWYRAQYMLQDQKIGHYMHVPQRAIFFSQLFGITLGVPINYAAMRWIVDTKRDYLTGATVDAAHIWTGQSLTSALTMGVQYVLLGPTRLFRQEQFRPLPYAFLVGAGAPAIIYLLHRLFPRAKFHLFNTTIFFSGASIFYGNVSTGYFSRFLGGFVVMFWAYRYRYQMWAKYNFILAAAFDAGFNLNMLLIFLIFGSAKVIGMPNWWGNDAGNVEKCYALN